MATGVESSVGVKDPQKLRDFVAAARAAEGLVPFEHRAPDAYAEGDDADEAAPYDWMEG